MLDAITFLTCDCLYCHQAVISVFPLIWFFYPFNWLLLGSGKIGVMIAELFLETNDYAVTVADKYRPK